MLKQVVLTRRRAGLAAQLAQLTQAADELKTRGVELQTREVELEAALNEVDENTSDADRAEIDAAISEFETQQQEHEQAVIANDNQQTEINRQIAELDAELDELNEKISAPKSVPEPAPEPKERKENKDMDTRKFFGMNVQERDAFFARQDVKDFLQRVREFRAAASTITGKELLIPEVALGLLRDQISEYSRLIRHVNLRRVPGKARQRITGTVPEAVWTEMCASLNELSLAFGQVDVDGYKVGGYIAVCNAVLEDSDIALATEIFNALGQAIGMALDKAILYGTGNKMPIGIATRLAQTVKPDNHGAYEPEWKNLSTTNVITIEEGASGLELFRKLALASGKARSRYATGGKLWIMTEATHLQLMAEAMEFNASGSIVSGFNSTMPVVGGTVVIVTDNVMPDGTIFCGYGDLYLLAERAGTSMAQSEHVRFIEDQTVFKATARYDGRPVFGEAFIAIGLGAAPTMTAEFAADIANGG